MNFLDFDEHLKVVRGSSSQPQDDDALADRLREVSSHVSNDLNSLHYIEARKKTAGRFSLPASLSDNRTACSAACAFTDRGDIALAVGLRMVVNELDDTWCNFSTETR
ncbi:MAG: hypothetical protein M3036_17470, partial [Bifidobacteriales bacterium]|nr:hypothetical protein [Bifidobacteriales bacterium]